jgi:hypothetical protein
VATYTETQSMTIFCLKAFPTNSAFYFIFFQLKLHAVD